MLDAATLFAVSIVFLTLAGKFNLFLASLISSLVASRGFAVKTFTCCHKRECVEVLPTSC